MNTIIKGFKTIYFLKWHPLIIALIMGIFVFLLLLGLRHFGLLQILELKAHDLKLWSQKQLTPLDDRIILILANDKDQRKLGWPFMDTQLVDLLTKIQAGQPQVIGLDLYRDLPVPLHGSQGYDDLVQFFQQHHNIIGIYKHQDSKGASVAPPPTLEQKRQIGFNDIPADINGIIRRHLLFMADEQGQVFEYFGLKVATYYLYAKYGIYPQPATEDPSAMRLGKALLVPLTSNFGGYVNQDTAGFQLMLDYPVAPRTFQTLSITEVLSDNFDPNMLNDKIVLIGVNAEATPDFVYTPFGFWMPEEQRVPGVMIHAYSVSQFIRMALGESTPLKSWSEAQEIIWIGVWSLLGALLGLRTRSFWRWSFAVILGFATIIAVSYLSFVYYTWVIVAAPMLGWTFSLLLMQVYLSNQEKQERAVLMQLFSKHVSKAVANEIWRQRDQYLDAGRLVSQRVTATVLFTDLQNFTTVSENMEPQALMDWLNEYMEKMVEIVEKQHCGQVNKFIGDAIMAVFGVPVPSIDEKAIADDATRAIDCALSMRCEMKRFHEVWQANGQPIVQMRIGIFTGNLVVGSLGSVERQEYAVLGDTVNTASRLESFDKNLERENPCRILIGKTTLQYTGDQFITEQVGEVNLKGKMSQVAIYSVISRNPNPNEEINSNQVDIEAEKLDETQCSDLKS